LFVALTVASASCALGQENRHVVEAPVKIHDMQHLHVTSRGRIINDPIAPGGGFGQRDCNVTATWTDASFTGGTYIMEAGMGQGEMFAATYTLPASAFPIQIVSAEQIWAVSNASEETVTQWSVLFYQGHHGTLVATETSDDVVLPYIRLGPGTAGTDVEFSIDPSDPDQLFINDDGSHTFTVAWRVDHHNDQTGDPCVSAPPTCCNAFMVVDNSGLQHAADNWLFGLNCGAFGCPANGGWASFQALPSYCRPSGDVVTRTIWKSVSCNPGVGACCVSGTCSQMTTSDCASAGGTYQGDGTACSGVTCPQPQGACCFSNGFCAVVGSSDCAGSGGTFAGAGSVCGANNTCPLGSCCLTDGTCVANLTAAQCAAQSGTFRGVGSDCSTPCPPPNGACCASNGFCFQTSQANCAGSGGTFYGAGVACGASNTCPVGACCMADGSCQSNFSSAQCSAAGGTFHGIGSTCSGANCPQPQGACCASNGFCFVTSNATCTGSGGHWGGPNTTCADNNGNGQPDVCEHHCGSADFNCDGAVGTDADIESFFACLSGDCPPPPCTSTADFNGDGATGTDADIESFFRVLSGGPC
jgi:hypothetical protein